MTALTLTPTEITLVSLVGYQRMALARIHGRSRLNGLPGEHTGTDRDDLIGAAAEYAVAKLSGRFWNALADIVRKDVLAADVGRDLHVKAVSQPHHNLIVKPDDPKFGVYVLCHVDMPTVEIIGAYPAALVSSEDWDDSLPVAAYLIRRNRLMPTRTALEQARVSAGQGVDK